MGFLKRFYFLIIRLILMPMFMKYTPTVIKAECLYLFKCYEFQIMIMQLNNLDSFCTICEILVLSSVHPTSMYKVLN